MSLPSSDSEVDQTLPTLDPHPGSIPPPPPLGLTAAGRTDVGKQRARNEDQFLVARLGRWLSIDATSVGTARELTSPQGALLVVADGMGGHGGGDVASAVALDAFVQHSLLEMPWLAAGTTTGDALLRGDIDRFVASCQERLVAVAERKKLPPKLGTTLTAAYLQGTRLVLAHVGDSRAYLWRAGKLARLTHDHTLGAQLADRGAPAPNLDHILVNAIGGSADVPHAEMSAVAIAPGDRVLLCSDGLHGPVDEATIGAILEHARSAAEAVDRLIDAALERGAPDNVTAVAAFT
jgi:protein phosphatase